MRITGGELRGRRLKVPAAGAVRPTQDAVREALFSMLALRLPGCAFLDLFAGSGAVGIEAWSRGAEEVVWVEAHRGVARGLATNVETLCGGIVTVVTEDVFRWLQRPAPRAFDLVYADPPYGDRDADDRIGEVMERLAAGGYLAPDGVFVAEQRTGRPMPAGPGWNRIKDRRYGHTRLTLLTRTTGAAAVSAESGPSGS
jgi:16S rRNA (guanine966-N2)-methyltransferase